MDQPTSKDPRGPVSLRIKFRSANLDQFIERYAVDVSRGGIFIRTREPLAVGTQLRFDFQLQDAAPLLAGEGTIVWIRENDPTRAGVTPGMGVRFDKLTAASQPVLEKILAEKARREQAGAPAKPGPAGGMAVRRPSSTFSALDPAARAAAAPPRVGGLSPLGAQPRAAAPSTGSGPVGAQPRTTAPAIGSDPFGTRSASAAPAGVPQESSGAFGRPRSTTGMNAQRPAPAPSALFEKPSAEDIDRALSVLTEVDGPAPAPVPVPVDFSSRVRRPTDAQPMVVESAPDVGDAPKAPHRRATDAAPMVLESMPDVGGAPSRRVSTQPLGTGPRAPTGETRAATVPVMTLGELGHDPAPAQAQVSEEPLHDEEEEDDATTAWEASGPTRAGGEVQIPAAAKPSGRVEMPASARTTGKVVDPNLGQAPTIVAKLGEGTLAEARRPDADSGPPPHRPSEAKPAGRASSPVLPSVPAPPPTPSLDEAPSRLPAPSASPAVAPTIAPTIMAPDFAAPPAKKKSSGGALAVLAILCVAGGGASWYFLKGPGAKRAPAPAATEAPAPEGTAPAQAAAPQPEKAAGEAKPEAKPAEAAKPSEAQPAEAKPPEAKPPEAKPAETKTAESKPEGKAHRSKRRASGGGQAASEQKPAAEAAPAVADVSPKGTGDEQPAEAKPAEAKPAETKPSEAKTSEAAAGGGHVLKITSSPPGAEVIVDGTSMGTTPFSSGDVDPSLPHSVTIKKDGFEAYEHMIGGADWPRAKAGVRTLKLNAKLRSTGGEAAPKPADDNSAAEPPPGLGTTPASPKRE